MTTLPVSTNYICDRETRELGEAFPEIAVANEKIRLALESLQAVQKTTCQRADSVASELILLLRDALHDSSWASLVGDAEEAFSEARVVKMERKPELRIVK